MLNTILYIWLFFVLAVLTIEFCYITYAIIRDDRRSEKERKENPDKKKYY